MLSRKPELCLQKKKPKVEADQMGDMDRAQLEYIYGLLWLMPVDTTTVVGMAASLARKAALEMIDKDGQERGISAAQNVIRMKMMQDINRNAEVYINPRAG
jgi:hypothetical protein